MLLLLIPIIVGTFIWLAFAAYKSLVRRNATATWLMAFYLLFVVGAGTGIYFGFFFSYFVSPTLRVYSFPVPAAFLVLETSSDGKQNWVDFLPPAHICCAGSNIPIFASIAVLPLWFASLFRRFPIS